MHFTCCWRKFVKAGWPMVRRDDDDHPRSRRPWRSLLTALWWRTQINKKRVILAAVALVVLYIWWWLLLLHGTVSPLAVWAYTAPYDHRASLSGGAAGVVLPDWSMPDTYPRYLRGDGPPEGWRPPFRLVLTLSSLPHHKNLIEPTLQSLLTQSLRADVIYLALPEKSRRTGESYGNFTVPEGITILRSKQDYGPLTKLLPAVMAESEPDAVIITLDDDKVYPPDLIRTLAWNAAHNPYTAIGVCGWGFMWVPMPTGVVPVYVAYWLRGQFGQSVDILQAVCGNAYRRAFFDAEALAHNPPGCFTTDDMWISGYLAMERGVGRMIIPQSGLDPVDTEWKAREGRSAFALSSVNTKNYQDIKCIADMEAKYGKMWPTAAKAETVKPPSGASEPHAHLHGAAPPRQ